MRYINVLGLGARNGWPVGPVQNICDHSFPRAMPCAGGTGGPSAQKRIDFLARSYQLGVNAYIVKPVQFQEVVEAVKQVGAFWAVLNEPPPGCVARSQQVTA